VKATIVMPTSTPLIKVNRTKSYGAEVVLYGDVYDDACQYALKLAEEKGYTFIHPFDDLDVATGQSTVAMEILKDLPFVDIILVPVGGGGLATGVSTLAKMLNPNIKVIGVEPAGAACLKASLANDKVTTLPKVDEIPQVRFDKAKELVAEKYNRKIRNPFDLEPEEESLIGQYFKEEMDADFVFVTHYPSKKRPFYAMDDPEDTNYTLSFDLLFHGLEITTGGQRIHDYLALVDKIADRGMTQEGMEQYMMIFKHGMPPHGGLGIGLERLTMKILGEDNVRETTLFPRDLSRLEP